MRRPADAPTNKGRGAVRPRALLVYCHPRSGSFTAAVRDVVLAELEAGGAQATVIDLYAERFDPVLSAAALEAYADPDRNRAGVERHVDALLGAEMLIFVYPTWWYGAPAMLKGWLERVLLPGGAFELPDGVGDDVRPALLHVTRLGVFTTGGASWMLTRWIGARGERALLRGVGSLCHPRRRTAFAMHYSMDSSTPTSRARHLARVRRKMRRLLKGVWRRPD